jgi:UDP-N-acetylmuramate dehydrogenase
MLAKNISLQPYNTFGIHAKAQFFSVFNSVHELHSILQEKPDLPLIVLGGGSNILLKNNEVNAVVIVNKIKGIECIEDKDDHVLVKVGAGENWHEFVRYTINQNWGGIENLSLIPGSVGASPMQNIGAYGVEIKDVFHELEAYEISTGEIKRFNHGDCKFGYRESVFKRALKDQFIITSVTYRFSKEPHTINTKYGVIEDELKKMNIENPTIEDVSNAVIAIRQSKLPDPKEIGNAGSFFKNPVIPRKQLKALESAYPDIPHYKVDEDSVKVPAGWLIDRAGWKGKTFGHYGVHKNQALVLVNYEGASGKEIYELSSSILADIKEKFGITLEREVNMI